ncbi:glycosyltransferase family 4 protein [Cecembia lonarensis]|uniref:Spore coat protein SA n=1 Tax=Cecembia lonarensis (strain CCUG 58316 / KCTC 22772 / LW9) TaxID=1225176 RepID=K1L812_CECL9|nr:Spore coat protein SA [Cecembia lonarensis LW9]
MSHKGRVIFLHSSSELYGASKILIYVIEIFRKLGYSTLLVLPGEGPFRAEVEKRGIEVVIVNLGILRRKYFSPFGIVNRGRKFLKAYRFLNKLHKEEPIKLVYSNTLAVIVGAIFAKRNKISHIWHIHEIINSPRFLVRFLARQINGVQRRPVVVSESVAQHWAGLLNLEPEVIHNGIDYEPFLNGKKDVYAKTGLPEDRKIVTMIGRVNPGKGQLSFLKMAKEVIREHPDALFLLVGDPYPGYENLLEEVGDFIQDNGLGKHVMDLGFRSDVPEILKCTNVFVLPSVLPDSFPTVVLEAMASALPVVATKSGGAVEMLEEGQSGYLIEIDDIVMGSQRINYLLSHPEAAKAMGKKGRDRVLNNFSYGQFAQKMEEYICQIFPETRN